MVYKMTQLKRQYVILSWEYFSFLYIAFYAGKIFLVKLRQCFITHRPIEIIQNDLTWPHKYTGHNSLHYTFQGLAIWHCTTGVIAI